jgi:hypothetical protein
MESTPSIHLPLKYEPLSKDAKKQIWENFLAKAFAQYGPPEVSNK